MPRLLQPALLIFGIAILLTTSMVASTRQAQPQVAWLFYINEGVLNRLDLNRGEVKPLPQVDLENYSTATWSSDGRWLIYEQNGNLFRRDHISHRVEPITLFPKNNDPLIWQLWRDWLMIYRDDAFYTVQVDRTPLQKLGEVPHFSAFGDVSQDGQKLLFSTLDGDNEDIYVLDIGRGQIRQLTDGSGREWIGQWSLSDDWVVFLAEQGDERAFFQIRPDGTELQSLDPLIRTRTFGYVSPDEQWILVDYEYPVGLTRSDGGEFRELSHIPSLGNSELFEVWSADSSGFITASKLAGDDYMQEFYWNSIDGTERHLVENSTLPQIGAFNSLAAPDGSAVVYEVTLDGSNNTELFFVPTNGDPVVQLTNDFTRIAAWSPDSKWIVVEMIVGECCFPHSFPNELFRIFVEDGRIERLTYTAGDEYPTYMGMVPIVELEWDWWVNIVAGIVAVGLGIVSIFRFSLS